jgi:hypothetical protein
MVLTRKAAALAPEMCPDIGLIEVGLLGTCLLSGVIQPISMLSRMVVVQEGCAAVGKQPVHDGTCRDLECPI